MIRLRNLIQSLPWKLGQLAHRLPWSVRQAYATLFCRLGLHARSNRYWTAVREDPWPETTGPAYCPFCGAGQ